MPGSLRASKSGTAVKSSLRGGAAQWENASVLQDASAVPRAGLCGKKRTPFCKLQGSCQKAATLSTTLGDDVDDARGPQKRTR